MISQWIIHFGLIVLFQDITTATLSEDSSESPLSNETEGDEGSDSGNEDDEDVGRLFANAVRRGHAIRTSVEQKLLHATNLGID